MPAISANGPVLVSGGSGFLAIHCINELLQRGHPVRATVRSNEKGDYLRQVFKRYDNRFGYIIAEDVEKPGVFDEAVKGCEGVLHTASPFHFDAEGKALDNLVHPAVKGTKNMLESIVKEKGVKRVVITSSFAAILDRTSPGHAEMTKIYTEEDWNVADREESDQLGNSQVPMNAYRASKSHAELAAWQFVEAHQPDWDLSTINPPFILGPIIHQCESPEKLNTSMKAVWTLMHGGKKEEELANPSGAYVDGKSIFSSSDSS